MSVSARSLHSESGPSVWEKLEHPVPVCTAEVTIPLDNKHDRDDSPAETATNKLDCDIDEVNTNKDNNTEHEHESLVAFDVEVQTERSGRHLAEDTSNSQTPHVTPSEDQRKADGHVATYVSSQPKLQNELSLVVNEFERYAREARNVKSRGEGRVLDRAVTRTVRRLDGPQTGLSPPPAYEDAQVTAQSIKLNARYVYCNVYFCTRMHYECD